MSTKPTKRGAQSAQDQFELPSLPDLPDLPDMPDMPDVDRLLSEAQAPGMPNPFDALEDKYGDSLEENAAMDVSLLDQEYAAIQSGRRQQQEAVALANETDYWFAVYFQTQDQKEAFLKLAGWFQHGDKYLDGQWLAKKLGITLPPRPAPYKVGRMDKKLTDLT